MASGILESIRFLLLTQPLEEFRHEADKVPAYRLPFIQRYLWVSSISPRGIGWSFGTNYFLAPVDLRHHTRVSFVASRLRRIFVHYFLFEFALLYTRCNPVFTSPASLGSQGYLLQCLNLAAIPTQLYAGLTCVHSVLAIVAVGAGLDEPRLWPGPFGRWKDAYTIQRFWSRTWHQFTRNCLTVFGPHRRRHNPWDQVPSGDSSARRTTERKSWMMAYLRICNAFLCSAFMHLCGDIVIQFRIWENSPPMRISSFEKPDLPSVIGFSIPFYIIQPLGVLLEGIVMELGKSLGLKSSQWTKILGYMWVAAWLSVTALPWMDNLKDAVHAAYPPLERGAKTGTTLIEAVLDQIFGINLASAISTWLAGQ
ncbi:hypothetical protein J3A83DRAFT_4374518 [Scleroderma citrinum]